LEECDGKSVKRLAQCTEGFANDDFLNAFLLLFSLPLSPPAKIKSKEKVEIG